MNTVEQYVVRPVRHSGHCPHGVATATVTRSPSFTCATPLPRFDTTPAHSWPQIAGLYGSPLAQACRSVPQMPQNATSTTALPVLGYGSGI